jgi:FkbM family methyltransferase
MKNAISSTTAFRTLLKDLTPPLLLRMSRRWRRLPKAATESDEQRLLRLAHEKLNAGVHGNVIVIRPGISLRMHPDAIASAKHFCHESPEMVRELDVFLDLTRSKHNFLDIGALHGIFSLAFAATHPDGRILAVDASPLAFAKLLYNVHANAFTNINVSECAASDRSGTLSMHFEWEHAVCAGTQFSGKDLLVVRKESADSLCSQQSFQPDVVKIDVEGHELNVLRGLTQVIRDYRPTIFLEIHPERILLEKASVGDIADFFEGASYSAVSLKGRPMPLGDVARLQQDTRAVFLPR